MRHPQKVFITVTHLIFEQLREPRVQFLQIAFAGPRNADGTNGVVMDVILGPFAQKVRLHLQDE